jgi:regulator of sigma E protease
MLAFLANAAIYVVPFLVIITFVVTIHELGHFLTARAFGVAVDRFSIGFGRAIASFKDRWGVEWRIAWLPLGGYVRFAGDENIASVPDQDDLEGLRAAIVARDGPGAEKRLFYFKPLWQRTLVVAAGPVANFVLAIALFAILFGAFGESVVPTVVGQVVAGEAAQRAGVRAGDVITALDGRKVATFDDLTQYIHDRAGAPTRLTILRSGRQLDIVVTPGSSVQPNPVGGTVKIGYLGIQSGRGTVKYYDAGGAIVRGAQHTWEVVAGTGEAIGRLFQGKADWPFSGLIGIVHASGALTKQAASLAQTDHADLGLTLTYTYVNLAALLSVSLGLVNILPIPVLDGGHLLFYAYESVARRPMAARVQAADYRVGLALLAGLMLFTTWHDLQRLQVFQHLLGALFS